MAVVRRTGLGQPRIWKMMKCGRPGDKDGEVVYDKLIRRNQKLAIFVRGLVLLPP